MKYKSILLSSLAASLLITPLAFADKEEMAMLAEAKISLTEAIALAEKHLGGKATSASIDDDSFTPTFEVSVTKDGKLFDVQVDGVKGTVTGSREDLDD